jgi:4a-hydroxytetrahydrobiopterin dehydratase
MVEQLTQQEFHERSDLPDWRALLGRIEATFRAGSFAAAAALVQQIAVAADAAQHHPDIDVRYPDRVRVALVTHATSSLTNLDVELAGAISALARERGATSDPHAAARLEIAIDALDIAAIAPFWQAVLGYVPERPGASVSALVDPMRVGPAVWFQQMDVARPQRNRIHLDITVPHDVADERIAAALAAGGRLLDDAQARAFWVLADAEGNEICVCTWQDRSK